MIKPAYLPADKVQYWDGPKMRTGFVVGVFWTGDVWKYTIAQKGQDIILSEAKIVKTIQEVK